MTDFSIFNFPKLISIVLLTVSFAVASFILPSCSGIAADSISESEISDIRSYADPETETTLRGLSSGNLAEYTKYCNEAMKAAVTPELLDKTAAQINLQLGSYISKEFLRVEQKSGYIIVHYRAKYSRGEAGIRMVFDKDHLVAGQWFE